MIDWWFRLGVWLGVVRKAGSLWDWILVPNALVALLPDKICREDKSENTEWDANAQSNLQGCI